MEQDAGASNEETNFWVASFQTAYSGQTQYKYHYCHDLDILKHFVLLRIEFYNQDTRREGLPETELNKELLKPTGPFTWESACTRIHIFKHS